ncbi:MAG: hypothetical protein JWP14_2453 [Frankiales bacterium]|jgi:hypothetical protein|nr:hypothetical protein [Frankiales bacterium]
MPVISKTTAAERDLGIALDCVGTLDDYTVDFVTVREEHSLAEMLKGLPDDRCQCPHWGYLTAGRLTVEYADRTEVIQPGDAFYMAPGHVPAAAAGSEFVQFSPTDQLAPSLAAMQRNAERLASAGN